MVDKVGLVTSLQGGVVRILTDQAGMDYVREVEYSLRVLAYNHLIVPYLKPKTSLVVGRT
jgi:predicted transcriptional regulator